MKYRVTYVNRFEEPYYNGGMPALHDESESWTFSSKKDAVTALCDFMSAPQEIPTPAQVRDDFGKDIPESKILEIQEYYAGRREISEIVSRRVSEAPDAPGEFRYDIPEKYNMFSIEDKSDFRQIEAYLKVEVTGD